MKDRNSCEALTTWLEADGGQDLLEYGFLAALIALVVVAGVTLLGQRLDQVFWQTIAAAI